jgi:hypothetical protein
MNLINLLTNAYPVSLYEVRQANPNVSFPVNPTDEDLAPFGYANVYPTLQPTEYDPRTQRIEEATPEPDPEGIYQQQWTIREATEQEIAAYDEANRPAPNYSGFYNDLIANPIYTAISMRAALFQPLLAASTEFIAAFADAKAGNPNPDAIRMTVWRLFYWLKPSVDEVAAIQTMLEDNNLADLYSLEIPVPVLEAFNSLPNPFLFYQGVLGSNLYQRKLVQLILSGASSVPGDATTIMGFAIKDAQAGLVPPPVVGAPPNSLQSAIWLFMAAVGSLIDEDDVAELQTLLDAANLSGMYSLLPPT